MIRAVIVDDEPLSRRAVRQMCSRHQDVTVVTECRNGEEAAAVLRDSAVDVMFLDVKLPGLTGLDVARCRRSTLPLVVFVTAFDEFAVPAFDTAAIDYLTKPIHPVRFGIALDRVRRQLRLLAQASTSRAPLDLVVRCGDRDILLPEHTIEYIAAEDVYASVHSSSGVHLIRRSLDQLEAQLDPQGFARVHRSFIVRVACVAAVRRIRRGARRLVMRSGAEVPVSRRRSAVVQRLLTPHASGSSNPGPIDPR